jgi:hypothetical protein
MQELCGTLLSALRWTFTRRHYSKRLAVKVCGDQCLRMAFKTQADSVVGRVLEAILVDFQRPDLRFQRRPRYSQLDRGAGGS